METNTELYFHILKKTEKDNLFNQGCIKATQCIRNSERSLTLMDIVEDVIKNFDSANLDVIDLGAGSGVLGLTASIHGAKRVILVDDSRYANYFMKEIVKDLGFQQRNPKLFGRNGQEIEIHTADAIKPETYLSERNKFDLVIAELVGTGFLEEPLVEAVKNIQPYTHFETLYIPESGKHFITLCDGTGPITESFMYQEDKISNISQTGVNKVIEIPINKTGIPPYSVNFDTVLGYPNGAQTEKFGDSLCPTFLASLETSQFLKVNYPYVTKEGQTARVSIRYHYGSGSIKSELINVI